MESSAAIKLIYQAAYITVFIIATSITINLFASINDYSDKVSEVVKGDRITDFVSENENSNLYDEDMPNEVSGYELFEIVNNCKTYNG